MNAYRYNACSPAEAFAMAAKDTKNWEFPTMEALSEMAGLFRDGYRPMKSGLGYDCNCSRGYFKLYDYAPKKEYGIALVVLYGHEVGVDDPAAQEVLDFHRDRLDEPFFAGQLLNWSEHIDSLTDLDRSYSILVAANLIEQTHDSVIVDAAGERITRQFYVVRSRHMGVNPG